MMVRAWIFWTFALLQFSFVTLAEDGGELTCEPALSSGFEAAGGTIDLSSKAIIAIDLKESTDVLTEIAQRAPEHYLTLMFLVALDGKIQPTPANPLISTIFRGFDSRAAMDIQNFLNNLGPEDSRAEVDDSPLYNRLWERILVYRDSSDGSAIDSCAFVSGGADHPTLWVAHESANCVRLVESFESSDSFAPFSGVTEVGLVRSASQFVELDTGGWAVPVSGAEQAPQYSAESVVFH
jgi:hypothetical protein